MIGIFANVIVDTVIPNMKVIYSNDYDSYGLNQFDLLSFTEVYD